MTTNAASVILTADPASAEMFGRSPDELVGQSSTRFIHADYHAEAATSWVEMLGKPGTTTRAKIVYVRADGEAFWAEVVNSNRLNDLGWIDREIRELPDRFHAKRPVEDLDRVIRGIADLLPSGIAQFDKNLRLVFANDRWREITGMPEGEERAANYDAILVEPRFHELRAEVEGQLFTGINYDTDVTLIPLGGTVPRRCQVALRPLVDANDAHDGFVVCIDDITNQWQMQQRLIEQAKQDHVTGLANRAAVLEHLDQVLQSAQGSSKTTAAIFLDLNGFKRVNDVYGHGAGDTLLREVGASISSSVRPGDLVARHGGDEFLVVCDDVNGSNTAMQIAHRILNAVTRRYRIDGELIDSSASCGVAVDVGGAHTAERMIAEADLAMYEQKRNNEHSPALFAGGTFEDHYDKLDRDSALARSVEDGTLVLEYQPLVHLATDEVVGYEALLRWEFEGILVAPDQFVGLAERRGLIHEMGSWTIDEVCKTAAANPRDDLLWSVNVSPFQLRDASFDRTVATALERHRVNPERIAVELTEGVLIAADPSTLPVINRLDEMGVQLIIDEFGTRHGSLDCVRNLPINGLKLDKPFTDDVSRPRTNRIVAMLAGMARDLDLRLIAKGIETVDQARLLRDVGVGVGQGYWFGRPASEPAPYAARHGCND